MAAEDLAILKEFVNPVYLEDDAMLKVSFFLCRCEKNSRRSRMCSSFPLFFLSIFAIRSFFPFSFCRCAQSSRKSRMCSSLISCALNLWTQSASLLL